jgi:hypothetical protein
LTSIFTVTREDLYDYERCPKIVAIKANRALTTPLTTPTPAPPAQERRIQEPATIGKIGEMAVALTLEGLPKHETLNRITHSIPQIRMNEVLAQIATQSVEGMDEIRRSLNAAYGEVSIIGRGEGHHPDLAGTAKPDFIGLTRHNGTPIIVEAKDSAKEARSYRFQAMFYNGIAEKFGLYLLRERVEGEAVKFSPQILRNAAETVLVYPRLATFSIVKEKYTPTESTIKEVWKAKQLGFSGRVPEIACKKKCPHNRLKVTLPEGNMEPLPPLPLIFSQGSIEDGFDLDLEYQVGYAWGLLPTRIKLAVLFAQKRDRGFDELRAWLIKNLTITGEAVDVVLDNAKRESFLTSKPTGEVLLKRMESELQPWEDILKDRLAASASSILARGTAVYSLPKGSSRFVKDAWSRWS